MIRRRFPDISMCVIDPDQPGDIAGQALHAEESRHRTPPFPGFHHLSSSEKEALHLLSRYLKRLSTPDFPFSIGLPVVEDWSGGREAAVDEGGGVIHFKDSFRLDEITVRDLNLCYTPRRDQGSYGDEVKKNVSLFSFINRCETPFGERRLKNWLLNPLKCINQIKLRQNAINWLLEASSCDTSDLRRQFLAEIFNTLSKGRGVEGVVAALRSSNTVCPPRRITALLQFSISLTQLCGLENELIMRQNRDCNTSLPDLIFSKFPRSSIETLMENSAILLKQLDVQAIRLTGGISFASSFLPPDGSLHAASQAVSAAESELEEILTEMKQSLNCPTLSYGKSATSASGCNGGGACFLLEVGTAESPVIPPGKFNSAIFKAVI